MPLVSVHGEVSELAISSVAHSPRKCSAIDNMIGLLKLMRVRKLAEGMDGRGAE